MSVDKNLPPELVDRINTSKRRCFSGSGIIPKTEKAYTPASVHTGGWMPYTSITRNGGARMSSESRLVSRAAALTNNPSVMHTSETAHWLNRNAVNMFTSQFFSHLTILVLDRIVVFYDYILSIIVGWITGENRMDNK